MTDPFRDMFLLKKRIEEVAEKLNLKLVNIAFMPDETDPYRGPQNIVSCFFEIQPEAVKTALEIQADKVDADFAEIMGGLSFEEDEEGNVQIIGSDAPEEEEEPEMDEAERAYEERKAEAQRKLQEWIKGQDE